MTPQPMEQISIRLPADLLARIEGRASEEGLWRSDVVRRYVEAGDRADTRREQKQNTPA